MAICTGGQIAPAIDTFLEEVKATKSQAKYSAYENALDWFKANINSASLELRSAYSLSIWR
jgi:hypothetical protein